MDEDWRNTLRILMWPLGAGPGGVARMGQNPFCTVMLHIKLKVMKRRIQWCKNIVPGACLWVTRGQKVGFWVLFFYCHPTPLRFFLARTLKLSQVIALWMRTGGTHLEFWCAQRYAMALARGYAMARHQLALADFVFLIVYDNVWNGYSAMHFNEYSQHMFLRTNTKKYLHITPNIWNYNFWHFVFFHLTPFWKGLHSGANYFLSK